MNVLDGRGRTFLHYATELLEVNTYYRSTPLKKTNLFEFIKENPTAALEIIEQLLPEDGRTGDVEVNFREHDHGYTPLYMAAEAGNRAAVHLLLCRGANAEVEIRGKTIKEYIDGRFGLFDFSTSEGKVKIVY